MPNIIRQIATDDEFGTQTIRIIMNENERGPQGEQGIPGQAAIIEAGQAYSVPSSQSPAVINTGTSSNAVFDFYIPKGDRGPKGDVGPAGPEGPEGQRGPQGIQGQEGPEGPQGKTGQKGDTGPQGVQGPQGPQGEQGIQGPQGVQGVQGPAGKDFSIYKTYSSIAEMQADADNVPEGDFVLITSNPEDPDNAKLYVRTSSAVPAQAFDYLTDMSGAQGMKGETGPQGPQGPQGIQGPQGEPGPTYVAGDAITISGDVISANINPADFFTASATVSGTGNPVTLNNTIGLPLDSVQLDGDTTQQTYTGKNLFDKNNANLFNGFVNYSVGEIQSSATAKTLYIPITGGKTYTVSKTLSSRFTIGTTANIPVNGEHLIDKNQNNSATVLLLATSSNAKYLSVDFWRSTEDTLTVQEILDTVQIEEGSTATDYEPYVGGIPAPNPDYPQTVNTVTGRQTVTITDGDSQSQEYEVNLGKNLFDKDNANTLVSCYVDTGTIVSAGGSTVSICYIKCEPNTTYTVQKENTGTNNRFALFTTSIEPAVNGTVLNTVGTTGAEDNNSHYTITTPNNAKYLGVFFAQPMGASTPSSAEIMATIQIEKGSTATTYAPYFTPIELCKIGTYQDYIYKSGSDWYVHKATGKIVLGYSQIWSNLNAKTNYTLFETSDVTLLPTSTTDVVPAFSDKFKVYSNEFLYVEDSMSGLCASSNGYLRLNMSKTAAAGINSMRTWCENNTPSIYYALATPTDTKITDATLISQLEALASASTYLDNTILTVTSENLPAGLEVTALRNSLAGIIDALGRQ